MLPDYLWALFWRLCDILDVQVPCTLKCYTVYGSLTVTKQIISWKLWTFRSCWSGLTDERKICFINLAQLEQQPRTRLVIAWGSQNFIRRQKAVGSLISVLWVPCWLLEAPPSNMLPTCTAQILGHIYHHAVQGREWEDQIANGQEVMDKVWTLIHKRLPWESRST